MLTGLVFNIQKYSLHDGPGIRTTVFLKGCPLDCWWCHNPESQTPGPELAVIESRCVHCGACRAVCPQRDPRTEGPLPYLDRARCVRCGDCVVACPTGARQIIGRPLTVAQVLAEILQDRIFYEESGGGVTLSGGEPLQQFPFVRDLLAACRGEAIHTAVDTCGFAPREDVLALAPWTNLFLYDLKVMDDARHRQYTGVSNALILENLRALDAVHDNLWIRLPIIPGFNDDPANLDATARFVAGLRRVRQVNLLPYHALGADKGERLGQPHRLGDVAPPPAAQLAQIAERFRTAGLHVVIGR